MYNVAAHRWSPSEGCAYFSETEKEKRELDLVTDSLLHVYNVMRICLFTLMHVNISGASLCYEIASVKQERCENMWIHFKKVFEPENQSNVYMFPGHIAQGNIIL